MDQEAESQQKIEQILGTIIDEWYDKVSRFYITAEQLEETGGEPGQEELKRFHDDHGHRIKFSKDDLDFTYGLKAYWEGSSLYIEVSVNNKVENFDIEEFRDRLATHFRIAGKQPVPAPAELKPRCYEEIFILDSNFTDAFKLEIRKNKADIMRLSFRLHPKYLAKLAAEPVASKELVETYCVTPFRSIYASVYRKHG